MSSSPSNTDVGLSATTRELFRIWVDQCCSSGTKTTRHEARKFFSSLVGGTQIQTNDGTTLTTRTSHEQALAVLIQSLGPALESPQLSARSAALLCLTGALEGCQEAAPDFSLVQLLGDFFLSHCGPIESSDDDIDDDCDEQIRDQALEGLIQLIKWKTSDSRILKARLEMAQRAVERRYASPHGTADLSSLPRSRRSLCFRLLRVTVDAVAAISSTTTTTTTTQDDAMPQQQLTQFASFTARCLHGESDPRCLLQILQLLRALLQAFRGIATNFPVTEMFDAVAPYYPIQFTPPPNDVHGITREGLRETLLDVLTFTAFDDNPKTSAEDTMMNLTMGLFIETLVPPPEDGPPTLKEQSEGLDDLEQLIFRGNPTAEHFKFISDTLLTIHQQSSLAVVAGGSDVDLAKQLADQCRELVAKVAREAERRGDDCWTTFVETALQSLATRMTYSSSNGRIAIAYAACLCSSGGVRTLRRSLEVGLMALLQHLDKDLDSQDCATTAFGVGAFFASTRAALDRKEGVVVTPHPLTRYSGMAVERLLPLLNDEDVRVAALRALESVFVTAPASHFQPEQVVKIGQLLKMITQGVLEESHPLEWRRACTQALGLFLGQALDDGTTVQADTILREKEMKEFLAEEGLVAAAGSMKESERCDHRALALASTCSLSSANSIVGPLSTALYESLKHDDWNTAMLFAETLANIFRETKSYGPRAFQLLESPSATGLISALVSCATRSLGEKGVDMDVDGNVNAAIEKALKLSALLKNAYRSVAINQHIDELLVSVNLSLPPEGDAAVVKSSIELSFLASALQRTECKLTEDSQKMLFSLKRAFCDFALAPAFHPAARSAAAQCLHSVLARHSAKSDWCIANSLMGEIIFARMHQASTEIRGCDAVQRVALETSLSDCIAMAGLLGSAAAHRGGVSSKTSNAIIQFLVDLGCTGKATNSFASGSTTRLDFEQFESTGAPGFATSLSVQAASAVGTILSSDSGSKLWKQRLTHIASKLIQQRISETSDISIGILATVSHVICCSSLRNIPTDELKLFARVVVRGLAPQFVSPSTGEQRPGVVKVTLASILKLLSVSSSVLNELAYPIITGAMRVYAAADSFDTGDGLACKLLALQTLQAATTIVGASADLKESKGPVVSILGAAMNHPSSLLRQAAVEVRNAWYIVE